jgi:hypothetical protein
LLQLLTAGYGTLLPRANAAACPQLAKADFASSSQHVREGQRIDELGVKIPIHGRCLRMLFALSLSIGRDIGLVLSVIS